MAICLQQGAAPNTVNLSGETALHFAVVSGQVEVVTALLNKGANPNIKVSNTADWGLPDALSFLFTPFP